MLDALTGQTDVRQAFFFRNRGYGYKLARASPDRADVLASIGVLHHSLQRHALTGAYIRSSTFPKSRKPRRTN